MSIWSTDEVLYFLECYKGEPCIWNPNHENHKNRKKVAQAWNRISEIVKKPLKEMKHKKEILMVTFRKQLKRKKESMSLDSGYGELFEPSWFAYPLMESFLEPIYNEKSNSLSESQLLKKQELDRDIRFEKAESNRFAETIDEYEEVEVGHGQIEYEEVQSVVGEHKFKEAEGIGVVGQEDRKYEEDVAPNNAKAALFTIPAKKMRLRSTSDVAEKQMFTAFIQLSNVLNQRHLPTAEAEDDCDLYVKLLAQKLRHLSPDQRKIMMYNIDGLFIRNISGNATSSPQFLNSNSSPSDFEPIASIGIKTP